MFELGKELVSFVPISGEMVGGVSFELAIALVSFLIVGFLR